MGPTNVALVKLFQADQALREAQARLDAAQRNVRVQERRVADFQEKFAAASTLLKENQASAPGWTWKSNRSRPISSASVSSR